MQQFFLAQMPLLKTEMDRMDKDKIILSIVQWFPLMMTSKIKFRQIL